MVRDKGLATATDWMTGMVGQRATKEAHVVQAHPPAMERPERRPQTWSSREDDDVNRSTSEMDHSPESAYEARMML